MRVYIYINNVGNQSAIAARVWASQYVCQ